MATTDVVTKDPSRRWPIVIVAGLIIGAVEAVLAVAFAAFVFGGFLAPRLPEGIGLYLAAAALTLAWLAWRAGRRGVVGSVQDAAAAVLAVAAGSAAAKAVQLKLAAFSAGIKDFQGPDVFLTVVATTLIITVLCGLVFLVLGVKQWGSVIRFVPYPVVGGFLAGTGWLLFKGGIYVGAQAQIDFTKLDLMIVPYTLVRWLPCLLLGVALLVGVRVIKKPLVIPVVLGASLIAFVAVAVISGSGIDQLRDGDWLLGPFETSRLWEPWTARAVTGADWATVARLWPVIATALFVATLALLFNIEGSEVVIKHELDTNRELSDAGGLNIVSGLLGGIPGYHALSLTALATRMNVDGRRAGLVAALVPLAAVVAGASVVELIPRTIVGGVLVFVGLAFLVDWIWDKRKALSPFEYLVVLVVLGMVIWHGYLEGIVVGLVLALFLLAVSYGRVDLVREVAFADPYRSNVERSREELATLFGVRDRVVVLRVHGFVFFGSSARFLRRVRDRLGVSAPPQFLLIDLQRVTGMDSSAVAAFRKAVRMAEAHQTEVIVSGAGDAVAVRLAKGGVTSQEGVVRFELDLDRGLEHCEDALLAEVSELPATVDDVGAIPASIAGYLERAEVAEGTVLLHQGEPAGDLYVLHEGRLAVEAATPEGRRVRVSSLRPGAVVGELTYYNGAAHTADVVAETPCVVLTCTRARLEALEREDPRAAIELHRWFATTIAGRLSETMRTLDALLD